MRLIRALAALSLLPQLSLAQSASEAGSARVTLTGVVFDSLRQVPLANATVILSGSGTVTFSDSAGRFRFEGVAPGRYVANVTHDAIDSLGLFGLSAHVDARAGMTPVTVAIPSFGTFWRRVCGVGTVPADSGLIFGAIRNAVDESSIEHAKVELAFLDYQAAGAILSQRRWSANALTAADGSYAICGVPRHTPALMWASRDTLGADAINVEISSVRVVRRDLWLADTSSAALAAGGGVVKGSARDPKSQRPLAGVRISAIATEEARSDDDGSFMLRNVPLGTREITATGIGLLPVKVTTAVRRGDTATVTFELDRVSLLEAVSVNVRSLRAIQLGELEVRRARGMGRFVDSTMLARFPSLGAALVSVWPPSNEAFCALWIDGVYSGSGDPTLLQFRNPQDFAVFEIHTWSTPIEYRPPNRRKKQGCPVLIAWTKAGLPLGAR